MDAQLQEKWVDALRNGGFDQAQGTLHNQYGYCCLGVLARISGKGSWVEIPRLEETYEDDDEGIEHLVERESETDFTTSWVLNGEDGIMAESTDAFDGMVCEWIGLNQTTHGTLTMLNDSEGWTFEQIADFIEGRNLEIPISTAEVLNTSQLGLNP